MQQMGVNPVRSGRKQR